MTVRIVEGEILTQGSVSGTDATPFGIYAPTRAARVFLENPFLVPSFDQTVINTTASGSGVVIQGGGIVNVNTNGQIITVSGPAFEELEGDDVDSLNTLTGTVTLGALGTNTILTDVGTKTISVSGSTIPSLQTAVLPTFTPDSVLFVNSAQEVDEQSPDFQWVQSLGKNTLKINSDGANPVISGTRNLGGESVFARIDSSSFNPWFSSPATLGNQNIFEFDPNPISLMTFNTNSTLISTLDFIQDGASGVRFVFNNISSPPSVQLTLIPGTQQLNQLVVGGALPNHRLHLQPAVSVGPATAPNDPTPPWTLLDVRGDLSISGSTSFSMYVPDGLVNKPSFSFNEDQDSGLYRNGAGQICLTKDAIEELCVSTGNVNVPNSLTVSGVPVVTSIPPGVDSVNTLTGELSVVAGNNVFITDNGADTITISSFDSNDVDAINTVTGTVTIQGQNTTSVSTSAPIITISGAGIASLGPGPDGLVFIDDPTRGGKRLSIDRQVFLYSSDGSSDGTYLRPGNVINNFAGWILPRDATITAATYGYISGTANKDFLIRINNTTTLNTTNVFSATATVDSGLNIDVAKGDVVQIFVSATGGAVQDAFATIELAWRV